MNRNRVLLTIAFVGLTIISLIAADQIIDRRVSAAVIGLFGSREALATDPAADDADGRPEAATGTIIFQRGTAAGSDFPYNRGGRLYKVDPATGTETLFGDGSQPSFSSDGAKIVFLNNKQVMTTPTGSYSPTGLTATGGVPVTGLYPKFSPDGNYITYQAEKTVSGIDTYHTKIISSSCTTCDLTPELNPNGSAAFLFPSWHPTMGTSGSSKTATILYVRSLDNRAAIDAGSFTGDIFSKAVTISATGAVTEGSTLNLTNSPAFYAWPTYSHDGSRIAAMRVTGGTSNLITMNANGSNLRVIKSFPYPGPKTIHHPVWAPDDSFIAFSDTDVILKTTDSDTPTITDITRAPAQDNDIWPSWAAVTIPAPASFNNGPIVFSSDRENNRHKVFTIGADGRGLRCLMCPDKPNDPAGVGSTDPSEGYAPAFSPDSTKIAFVRLGKIWTMNADGTGQADTGVIGENPQWSPVVGDNRIVFWRDTAPSGAPKGNIFILDVSTKSATQIVAHAAHDTFPRWGAPGPGYPQGRIAFNSDRTGNFEIFVLAPAGTTTADFASAAATNVTNSANFDYVPSWSGDGTKLVYGSNGNIVTVVPGSAPTTVISGRDGSFPAFAPDGQKIVYMEYGPSAGIYNYDLWVYDPALPAAERPYNLTNHTKEDWDPHWGSIPAATTSADLSLSFTGPATVGRRAILPYNVNIVNKGPAEATGVKLTISGFPSTVEKTSDTPSYCSLVSGTMTCTLAGTIIPNGIFNRAFSIVVNANEEGEIALSAKLEADQQDPDTSNNTKNVVTQVVGSADLDLSLSGPTQATVETAITYSMLVTNKGPDLAKGVRVEFNMPEAATVSFVSAEPSSFGCVRSDISGGQRVTCNLGTQSAAAAPKITVRPHVIGRLDVGAQVFSSDSKDPNGNDDTKPFTTTIVDIPRADLTLTQTYSANVLNGTVRAGDEYSYIFTVKNNGPANATGTALLVNVDGAVSPIPSKTDARCGSDTPQPNKIGYICNLGVISNAATSQVIITVLATKDDLISHTAIAAANEPDASENRVSGDVRVGRRLVDLELLVDAPSKGVIDEEITLTARLKNHGPSTAVNASLQIYPNDLTVVSITGGSCPPPILGKFRTCSLGDIPQGEISSTIVIVVKAEKIGESKVNLYGVSESLEVAPDVHEDVAELKIQISDRIEVFAIEVTQAIQDLNNTLPILAGKPTVVRVHVRLPATSTLTAVPFTGALWGTNSADGIERSEAASNTGSTINAIKTPQRQNLDDSLYFELSPYLVQQGTLKLYLRSDTPLKCMIPGAPADCSVTVSIRSAPRVLDVRFYLLEYTYVGTLYKPNGKHLEKTKREFASLYPTPYLNYDFYEGKVASDLGRPDTIEDFVKVNDQLLSSKKIDCQNDSRACSKTYVGLLTGAISTKILGMANNIPGDVCSSYVDDNLTTSHELGHDLGRRHTNYNVQRKLKPEEPGFGTHVPKTGELSVNKDPSSPYASFGFDVDNTGVLSNYASRIYGPSTPDFMSYAAGRPWISAYNYTLLTSSIQDSSRPESTDQVAVDDVVVLSGLLPSTSLDKPEWTSFYVMNSPGSITLPPTGSYTAKLENAGGQQLAAYSFEPGLLTESTDLTYFHLMLPWTPGTKRVNILHDGVVIVTREASPNVPSVTVVSPNGGEVLTGSTGQITWSATDQDGDPLHYLLQFSSDGGKTWRVLATGLTDSKYDLSLNRTEGTTKGLVRILASDGFNSAEDRSNATFTIPEHAPEPTISTDTDKLYVGDQTIILRGSALDADEGLLADSKLKWSSNLNGQIGTGGALSVNAKALQEGVHLITLTATDSTGKIGTATINMQVFRNRPTFPASLSVNAASILFYAAEPQPQTLAIRNSGDGDLTWNAAADKPWIKLSQSSGSAPSNVEISLGDVSGLAGPTQLGTITVTSSAGASPQVVNVMLLIPEASPTPTPTPSPTGSISGSVNYYFVANGQQPKAITGATVTATGSPTVVTTTDVHGTYRLAGLGSGPYTVTVSFAGQINGISSQDAARVAQYSSGLVTLTDDQLIAADASGNGSVTSQDAARIAQFAAGITVAGVTGQWKFSPASRTYGSVSTDLTGQNFNAILVGDVTGNWTAASSRAEDEPPAQADDAASWVPVDIWLAYRRAPVDWKWLFDSRPQKVVEPG